jgi:hypothetical protein
VVSFTPPPLYPQGNSPWYPLDRRLGGPQSRSGRRSEEKNSQPPPGIEPWNPDRPAHTVGLLIILCNLEMALWGFYSVQLSYKEPGYLSGIPLGYGLDEGGSSPGGGW